MTIRFSAACLALAVAAIAFGADAATKPAVSESVIKDAQTQVEKSFDEYAFVLDISDEEKTKTQTLLAQIKTELREKPDVLASESGVAKFGADMERRYRAALTPAHAKAFDAYLIKQKRDAAEANALLAAQSLVMACKRYADQHNGALPARLTDLIISGDASPTDFVNKSALELPADLLKRQKKDQADWAAKETSFVFTAGGKLWKSLDRKFVVVFDKSGLAFARADGSAPKVDAKVASQVLTELKAGKNPPPALANQ